MALSDCPQVYFAPQSDIHPSSAFPPQSTSHPPFSAPQNPPSYQTERTSLSPSEPTSTTCGSENERVFSSGDDDSLEFQSDTAYDSVATRATMSKTSGLPGLEIERLFDEPSPQSPTHPLTRFDDLVPTLDSTNGLPQQAQASPTQDQTFPDRRCSFSVPNADDATDQDVPDLATPLATRVNHSHLDAIPSSSPPRPVYTALSPEPSRFHHVLAEKQERPGLGQDELWDHDLLMSTAEDQSESPQLPQRRSDIPNTSPFRAQKSLDPAAKEHLERSGDERRLSIFDWSEQPRSERDSLYGSSPRPRTVHSKQTNEVRGGRPPVRRAPNALHLRSQSVPVVRESLMDDDSAFLPAKFGTWGLGNKGVSEEWTDDFDFDEGPSQDAAEGPNEMGQAMKVPQAIIDRQASVHGQFGLVQEFMLLVEELKRLRHQASMLDLLQGTHHHMWEDAESIINLATLNDEDVAEEMELPHTRSSRLSGIFDEFDELSPPAHRPRQNYFAGTEHELIISPVTAFDSTPATPPSGRQRGESLAQAKSFLQTMHQNRAGIESSPFQDQSPPPKLPFDTQDLRDLVTRTSAVTRSLKEIVRKAEGVFVSPGRASKEPQDPPFSHIFHRPRSTSQDRLIADLPMGSNRDSQVNRSVASSTCPDDQFI